ncbi:hypothetical protein N7462_005454 [Penicillium macrosclerotiorum]|uniref:uncharacterized protein n=1 Tax=Penicillium macrosclerotiorum TaxID=303699 RepID=UPI00254983FB|nr:uncharacterized protein N7462_005454 [Penicillium macrosclerotiorum]KAJ5682289.1 hypothetical protein N7462_005454 [Penicillium macrosclerotiorum]
MAERFQPSQELEAKQLLHDLLTDNANMSEFYMHDCDDVRRIYQILKDFSYVSTPGRYIADGAPGLAKLIPDQLKWWRRSLQPMLARQKTIWMSFWSRLQKQLETGDAPQCFVKQFIQSEYHNLGFTDVQAAFLAGSLIEAGAESTSAAMNSCILYLSGYPEVQQRAHEELDSVVGSSRSPRFSDMEQLPYVRAIVKEILRIRPLASMGIPHYATADVTYKGFTIPKGSVIAIQQYAIHQDPSMFPEPEKFMPERYLGHPYRSGFYAASANPRERDHWNFGAGRRICPGMYLAENSLFITIAKILWAFQVMAPEKVDLSDDAYEPGSITVPKPFFAQFIPRSAAIERVLEMEWHNAELEMHTS